MKLLRIRNYKKLFCRAVILPLLLVTIFPALLTAQTITSQVRENDSSAISSAENSPDNPVEEDFRVEKFPVAGGAEIVTIFAKIQRLVEGKNLTDEVPLVSVLRDTLGDDSAENDRLRQVWILTYTKPDFAQKFAAAVPFLYTRTTNKGKIGTAPPPAVIDLNPTENALWDKIFWRVFRNLILGDFGTPTRAVTLQYKTNIDNYRKSAIARALAVLALYETIKGKKILTDAETKDIQARMMLSDKMLGSLVQSENLERVYQTNIEEIHDLRGRNWELLRQYSEAQGLYFEPLEMPDGSATHALVWTTESDIKNNKNKKFDSRFLNIKNPWNDARLLDWNGYAETRWFDEDNRQVAENTPNATPKKMIPLALYGLDYPKIPTLLIDFRDRDNPKKRELSRRVLNDLTTNILSVSQFASLPYFVGRYLYGFVTGRRGIDFNQPSRVGSYSQLKLLLALDESLNPQFRNELAERAEFVSTNPLENDLNVEARLAREQYENLIAYAARPDGLPKQVENERREEMVRLKHGAKKRVFYNLGNLLSFGLYTHREKATPELRAALDVRRRLDYHERYLRETARDSVNPAVDGNLAAIQNSLEFISQNGGAASGKTAEAVAKIFSITEDEQTRFLCLQSLGEIKNQTAKKKLLAIYENREIDARWRNLSAEYLHPEFKQEQDKPNQEAKNTLKGEAQ
ncbi:MAG: hypothetical protein ACR2N3_10600 [Pyrinomonadaceae bacterium]